jgi:hypothetical protein
VDAKPPELRIDLLCRSRGDRGQVCPERGVMTM